MLNITYAPQDEALVQRLQRDLKRAHVEPAKPVLLLLLSPECIADPNTAQAIAAIQRKKGVIIPITVRPTEAPSAIATLNAVDFSAGYELDALLDRLVQDVPMHTKVRTAQVRASNRRMVYVLAILVLGMFALALLAIGGGLIAFPKEEYDAVDTEVAQTQQALVGPTLEAILPRSTADAENFALTVTALPRPLQPLAIGTATASPQEEE